MPLPQIRIVSISPYPEMERIVQDVIAAHPQRGRIDNRIITATVDRLDLSELHDCDAIIARGYSARRLKAQGLGVPVIDIAISGYDVIRSIQECQRRFQTRRIGFVGFYNAFNGIEQFSGMFGCDIRVYIPECAAEIRHALELAKQDGCDVIVGGYSRGSRTRAFWGCPPSCCARAGKPTRSRWRRPSGRSPSSSRSVSGRKPIKSLLSR